jgi:hypothetical protein
MVKRVSDVTSEILATGEATMSQIAQMFETDAKTLPQRMKGIIPAGKRNGYRVYNIREAAGRLVKPGFEIEDYIRQMSPQELHPLLLKEFWNGQKARLDFEIKQGNYWPTGDVVEFIGVIGQGIRQTLLLVVDDIDREEELTDGQRAAFRRITDDAITAMNDEITKRLQEYHANREEDRTRTESLGTGDRKLIRVPDSEEDEEVDI